LNPRDDHELGVSGHHRLRVEKGQVVLDDKEKAVFPIKPIQRSKVSSAILT